MSYVRESVIINQHFARNGASERQIEGPLPGIEKVGLVAKMFFLGILTAVTLGQVDFFKSGTTGIWNQLNPGPLHSGIPPIYPDIAV